MPKSDPNQSFLLALGDRLRNLFDPVEIVAVTTAALGERLRASRVVYAAIDEAREYATTGGDWVGDGAIHLPDRIRLRDFGEALIETLDAGETLVVADVAVHPVTLGSLTALEAIGVCALVSVPLVKDGRFIANLNVHDTAVRTWTPDEIRLIEAIAERTWDVLERAHAVRALADRERELRTLTDAMPVLISYVDANRRYRFNNRLYDEWFPNRGRAGIRDRPVREVIGEVAYAGVEHHIKAALAGRHVRFEQTMPYGEAGTRQVSAEYVPRRGDDGRVEGFYALVQDISDRKAAETALRDSEARLRRSEEQLRLATDAADVGLWDVDLASDTLFWPPLVKAMFGISADVPVSMADFYAGLHPDDRADASAAFAAACDPQQRALYDVEYRTVGKEDGIVRWVAAKGRGIFDAGGICTRVLGTAIDITVRKANQADLRDLNERLEQRVAARTAERNRVWEMSRDLLAIMGFDGFLKAINPAWETVLGRDQATLLAMPFPEQVHPDDHPLIEAALVRLQRGETVTGFEDRLRHADGSWRWISWSLVPEGEVFYAVGRDVTDEKRAAQQLAHAQEALRQSQKMEAMGQLTGGVAHDFNNLLTPIIGSLDMLERKRVGDAREQRLIGGALQSAERAKTLVQRLLAFARRQPLHASAVDIGRLIGGMAELIGSTSGPQISIVVDVEPDLPRARADANQLEMALLNLGVNARDAMPGGGTLRIAAAAETIGSAHHAALAPGNYVRLSVADTGTGMDEETMARAIEPFFSTKGVGKGTGLGLSMVHGLASQLGGALRIESRPGAGTTIALWLPVTDEAPAAEQAAAAALPAIASLHNILLVDDEELVRASTAGMLADMGYRVVEAASADEALALVGDGLTPDLLVTDHLMPGMTGTHLAGLLRATRPDLPVLLVSGYADSRDIAADMPRLIKPFRSSELAASLAGLLPAKAR